MSFYESPRRRWKRRGLLALALVLAGLVTYRAWHRLNRPPPGTVSRVIDGDTVRMGNGERIRLLDIDAPELHPGRVGHDGPFPEPGAVEAYKALREMCEGRVVRVERHGRDRYGRTLAKLYLPDGTDVSEALLRRGLVEPYHPSGGEP
jgi:endonuclease YncB( thermonuclease family)